MGTRRKTDSGVRKLKKAAHKVSRPTLSELCAMPLPDMVKKIRAHMEDFHERLVTENPPSDYRAEHLTKLKGYMDDIAAIERRISMQYSRVEKKQ